MEVKELRSWFKSVKLPSSFQLNDYENIINVRLFLNHHFSIVECGNDNMAYDQHYDRLMQFKHKLEK